MSEFGTDAMFNWEDKTRRLVVGDPPPPYVIYAFRDCATSPVRHLELELQGVDAAGVALYRAVEDKRE
jgi:hypothetical protein